MVTGRYIAALPVLLLFLAMRVHADVTVETSPSIVRANEPFLLVVRASGKSVGEPRLPEVEGLEIAQAPIQQGDQYSMGTGMGASVTKMRGYQALVHQTGRIVIPPIAVEIDGKDVLSKQLVIDVQSAQAPAPAPTPLSSAPPVQRPNVSGGLPDASAWVFLTCDVDKREVYEGEPVKLTFALWRIMYRGIETGTYAGANVVFPTTEGFYASEPQSYRDQRSHNGFDYDVTEYTRMLYPTVEGDLTIGSWHWEGVGRVWGFARASQQPFTLSTEPIVVHVKALPAGPPDFSGAVGNYSLEATLSRPQTIQGVPVELNVVLSGRGNPDAAGEPTIPELEGVYVSEPQVTVNQTSDQMGVAVQKQMVYSVTPLNPGTLTIPSVVFVHFNPDTETFERAEAGPFTVKVLPSAERTAPLVTAGNMELEPGRIDVLNVDIHPIMTRPLRGGYGAPGAAAVFAWFLLPVAAYAGVALYMARQRRFSRDVGYARSCRAKAKALKRLASVGDASEPTDALYRALTAYLADKMGAAEAGMTASDAERLLDGKGVSDSTRMNVLKILKSCERARYASVRLSADELQALSSAGAAAVNDLDKTLGKERASC